jgi:hypothetical protein
MHLITNGNIAQTIDYAGRITKPSQPSFMASAGYQGSLSTVYLFGTTTGLNPQGGSTGNLDHNISGSYSTSTGRFTAPIAGRYRFHACVTSLSTGTINIWLKKNGTQIYVGQDSRSSNFGQAHVDVILNLNPNDYIEVYLNNTTAFGSASPACDYFCGYLVA